LQEQSAFALHADSGYRHDLNLTAFGCILAPVRQFFLPFLLRPAERAFTYGASMKKPRPVVDEPQPRKTIRADKAPTSGYSLVVDGHFKSHFDTVEAAEEAGMALKNRFQMLQVQVYDAENKTRSMIDWPGPA
jgi:hypothetical protein